MILNSILNSLYEISGPHLILLIITSVVTFYHIFLKETRPYKLMNQIPSPPRRFLFGNMFEVNVQNEEIILLIQSWTKLYGKRFAVWLGCTIGFSRVVMSDAKDVEKVLGSSMHISKSIDYEFLFPWLGTGLLTSRGEKWFRRRKLLTPSFHFRILEDFLEIFNEQAKIMIEILKEEFSDGRVFDIFPFVTRCTLDIICETAMGKAINAQRVRDSDYVKAVYRISELIQYRQLRPWFHPNFTWGITSQGREEKRCLNILHSFTEKVIQERKREFLEKRKLGSNASKKVNHEEEFYGKGKKRVAFMDSLLEAQANDANNQLTDLDIREETDTFMFEGHDTTAANVNWTIFLLACHPEYQAKVHEELDSIFGDDYERPLTTEDLTQMKYLEYCIKESLRLYPSVPILARAIETDLVLDENTIVPAGVTAMIMPYQLHRDPEIFPDPEAFIPDRFFPENITNRSPFAYVPFSAGPRNCIGQKFAMMEEKVVIAQFFRYFNAVSAEKREDLILMFELILRPKNGLHIKIIPRSHC